MSFDLEQIKRQAQAELENEQFREAVESYKEKLKTKRSLLDRLLPFKILIVRRKTDV